MSGSRWGDAPDVPRGERYDDRFRKLAADGVDVHGEATLVAGVAPGRRILDAGCGTGRVAIELAARGFDVVGVDLDEPMLATARANAPALPWFRVDLAALSLAALAGADGPADPFDLAVLAGNVLIFVAPGTEAEVVARTVGCLRPGGLLVAGFQVRPDGYGPGALDHDATAAGAELVDRWSTWDRRPWSPGGAYQVSVHRRVG